MAGLRVNRDMRFGRFQTLIVFMILVLQVAVNELADADARYPYVYQWPAIQWACEPLLNVVYFAELDPTTQNTRNLCLKLRGGKLGESAASVATTPLLETTTNETKSESVVVEKTSTREAETVSLTESTSSIESAELDLSSTTTDTPISDEYIFSVFQDNDGSESDPDGIPRRYLKMQHDNRERAKAALEATVEWRKQHDVNTILARPHPKFDVCKEVFPHYFCGHDDSNHVILLQRPGLINLPLAHANGLTGEDLLFHYIYEMEYLWQVMEKENPDATMTSVIDLTGLNIAVLRKAELMSVAKMFVSTMDAHFPQRSHKTFLINAPKWFGGIYKLISPLLRESTKEKISIFSKGKKQDEAMQALLSEHPIPPGKGIEELPPSDMEIQLRSFVSD
jgi:hypothetical protein